MMEPKLILVDEQDNPVGEAEKMETHRKGWLHRAFSIFIFNSRGEMLLQQRAKHKYHSGGLWTNACCSHPSPGELLEDITSQRLREEMGFTTPLHKLFDFIYRTHFENGLIEHEFDHVFVGEYDGPIKINNDEVMDFQFRSMQEIRKMLISSPEQFTVWFREAWPRIDSWWEQEYGKRARRV